MQEMAAALRTTWAIDLLGVSGGSEKLKIQRDPKPAQDFNQACR